MLSCARHLDITMLMNLELSTCSMEIETEEMSKPSIISRNRQVEVPGRLAVQNVHVTMDIWRAVLCVVLCIDNHQIIDIVAYRVTSIWCSINTLMAERDNPTRQAQRSNQGVVSTFHSLPATIERRLNHQHDKKIIRLSISLMTWFHIRLT